MELRQDAAQQFTWDSGRRPKVAMSAGVWDSAGRQVERFRFVGALVLLLALVGLFVALYLGLYKIGIIGTLQCGVGACEQVQTSRYADLFGVPVAFYGVVGYAVLLTVALLGLRPRLLAERRVTLALAALATVGVVVSLYLTYLELFVIHAICRWCVASAVIVTAIWVVAVSAVRRSV